MVKLDKCVRCGYDEMKASLHVHHVDRNHNNDSMNNLIVLCANCHYGLHRNQWRLSDIGIIEPVLDPTARKHVSKSYYVTEIDRLNESITRLTAERDGLKTFINEQFNSDLYTTQCKIALGREYVIRNYLYRYDYKHHRFVLWVLSRVPDSYFTHVNSEFGDYTKRMVNLLEKMFDKQMDPRKITTIEQERLALDELGITFR